METLTLTELIARIARRWRILVAGGAVGLLAGVIAQQVIAPQYEATTVLFIDAPTPDHVDMAAEQAVAVSRRVTSEALDALGNRRLTIAELERSTGAAAVKDSRLLRVQFTAHDPALAVRGADAVAQAYLAVRSVDAMGGSAPVDGTIVDQARTPEAPVGAGPLATLLGASAAGLLLAAPLAARPTRSPEAPAS